MKSKQRQHKHLFPIIDAMVDRAVTECGDEGESITCGAGCDHCCHLFIEVSWEEAEEIVDWIEAQPKKQQRNFIARVQENAAAARRVVAGKKGAAHLLSVHDTDKETPDAVFDAYFYKNTIPCAFLSDDKNCLAYESRPTACRLHLVSSHPDLCACDVEDDDDYEIPERVETLKEEAAPAIGALEYDGRWGHFGITVETVLLERGLIGSGNGKTAGRQLTAA